MKEQKFEGVPDGWELVRIGKPEVDEWVVSAPGEAMRFTVKPSFEGFAIIRKIEKPKRFRAFENAAEFAPHRDRWIEHKKSRGAFARVDGYGEKGATIQGNAHDYSDLFHNRQFDDGTPFGVEVVE